MERIRKTKEIFSAGWRYCCDRNNRLGYWLVVVSTCCITLGCTTLKKAGIVGLAGGTGALAGTVLSGGVAAPILGATTTAFVADVVTATQIGNKTMNNCAPDNSWTLLGSLIEMGGWALILIVVVPMIFSWLMPGPIQFKKKNGS